MVAISRPQSTVFAKPWLYLGRKYVQGGVELSRKHCGRGCKIRHQYPSGKPLEISREKKESSKSLLLMKKRGFTRSKLIYQ